MKGMFQIFITVFVGISFLLLSACPKQIVPTKKRIVRRVPPKKIIKPPVAGDPAFEVVPPTPMQEEDIPQVAQLDEVEAPALNNVDKSETASVLKEVFFDLDQWAPRPIDRPILENNVAWLLSHPKTKVKIEGHGDNRGTNEYNLVLGEKRANSIKSAMGSLGIDAARLTVVSYGEERPFCKTDDESCFQENRRVHFHVE